MMNLAEHPTVKEFRSKEALEHPRARTEVLDAEWLRQLCLEEGADDVGFVEISRPEIADQRNEILAVFPHAKTLVSFVRRMHPENVRSPARSIANLEFHHTDDEVNEISRRIAARLKQAGVRALSTAMGFPMEMDRWPRRTWVVSHKPVAVAAGLGHMGIHRNLIHPKFGNFILLGTVVLDAALSNYSRPLDYNPCLECKLCVAACPTAAIGADGYFNFSACFTHNYREFMGGFIDWVENIAESKNAHAYRKKVNDAETVSMWQSLSFGANYKAAYCMAVCPAGEDVIRPFLTDRKQFLQDFVRPLQEKSETVYVIAGSDAEAYVARRFARKKTKRVSNGMRPASVRGFLQALPLAFQREQSEGLDATYHFTFTGVEQHKATVIIRNKTLEVSDGHTGRPNLQVTADSETWLGFLAKEKNLIWALLRHKIQLKGSPRLLRAFARCFPG